MSEGPKVTRTSLTIECPCVLKTKPEPCTPRSPRVVKIDHAKTSEDMANKVLSRFNTRMSHCQSQIDTDEITVGKASLDQMLRQRSAERAACLSIPFTAAFVGFYAMSA